MSIFSDLVEEVMEIFMDEISVYVIGRKRGV